jgi:hypothetical protein
VASIAGPPAGGEEQDMIELVEQDNGKILQLSVTGKLIKEDYEVFVPVVERLIARLGKIRILLEMHDFHGWSAAALWEDVKFDVKHFRDIDRLALIGEKAWQKGMATFCKPFTTAQVRFFPREQTEEALAWLRQEVAAAVK